MSTNIRLLILMLIILSGCATTPPTPQPTTTPLTDTLQSQLASLNWITSIDSVYIQPFDTGGSQTIITLTVLTPADNTLDRAVEIYAYALETIFGLDIPSPYGIIITIHDGTTSTTYEQRPGETGLTLIE